MKRSWLAALTVTLAAFTGATVPILACSVDEFSGGGGFSSTGAPSASSSGSGEGAGGGPLSDAQVDVILNNDDPPPFTGKSYCSLCGGGDNCEGLGCDPTSGECVDGGTTMNGMGCKLVPDAADGGDAGADDDGGAGSSAMCAAAGDAMPGYGCMTSADCQGGYGCTKVDGNALCLPYCCQDTESCAKGTWCVPEHVVDGNSEGPNVPVCIAASNCSLLDDQVPCPNGLMCTIVRTDGTTACVRQGSGIAGDHCPCAPDYVCSHLADKCFKLCHVGQNAECPSGPICVGGMGGYPDGIGNCLGGTNN